MKRKREYFHTSMILRAELEKSTVFTSRSRRMNGQIWQCKVESDR